MPELPRCAVPSKVRDLQDASIEGRFPPHHPETPTPTISDGSALANAALSQQGHIRPGQRQRRDN